MGGAAGRGRDGRSQDGEDEGVGRNAAGDWKGVKKCSPKGTFKLTSFTKRPFPFLVQ